MAGAGEAIGGIAQAVPATLELPIKIAGQVLEWKKFKAGLHEGGVVDAFVTQDKLLEGEEAKIAEAFEKKTGLKGCEFKVQFHKEGEGKRIIAFRAPNSKAKMALRLEWDYKYASIQVVAKEDLEKTKKDGQKETIKAGTVLHEKAQYGGFIDNVRMVVHNATHISGGEYAFTIGGKVKAETETIPGGLVHSVDVFFSLAPHITRRKFQGEGAEGNLGREPRQFRFTIAGNKSVTYHDEEGNVLTVPRVLPDMGEHFFADEIVALQQSAELENQGVLFSLNKGKGKQVDVVAIEADELKVKTHAEDEADPPSSVKGLKLIMVIGPHSAVLAEYLKRYGASKEGKLRYSSVRGHGTWTFEDGDLKDLQTAIETEVKRQFEKGGSSTKKTIRFT